MSKGRFLKNFAAYSIADILGKSILLLLSPLLTRLLTHSQYGSIPLLAAGWAILSVIQYGGFDFAFQMFRAQTTDLEEREKIRVTATVMSSVFLLFFWLCISSFALFTDVVIEFAAVTRLELLFFLLAIIPSSIAYWSIYVFRFMHLALPYARINLLTRVASLVITIPFIILADQEDRLLTMLAVMFIAQSLSLLWVVYEFNVLKITFIHRKYFSKELAVKMFKFGAAFLPSTLIYSSTIYIDRMIMGYFTTTDQIAILGLAVTLSTGILMVKTWFSMVWDPQLLEWLATKQPEFYLPKLQSVLNVLTVIFLSLTLFSKLWSREFVDFVFPEHFGLVADLIPFYVLAGSVAVFTLVAIASAIIGNTARFRTVIYSGALAANITTAIILIPRVGLKGAAMGTFAGEITILLSWIVIGKYLLRNLDLKWLTSLIFIIITFIFITFYQPGFLLDIIMEKLTITVILALGLFIFARNSKFYEGMVAKTST